MTSTNTDTGAFGQAQLDVVVINDRPTAVIHANPPYISKAELAAGHTSVNFDGSESTDPDCSGSVAECLTFRWDFDDGSPTSTRSTVDHTFRLPSGVAKRRITCR